MWEILKEKETGYYGIQQYVKNSTAKPKGQTDRLDEGTLTRDDNFEDMLLKSSNLSKIVREKSKKTQSKIDKEIAHIQKKLRKGQSRFVMVFSEE